MRTAAPCSITARRRSSVPSTRPAANSTASSVNPSAEPSSYPQIPRTRHTLRYNTPRVRVALAASDGAIVNQQASLRFDLAVCFAEGLIELRTPDIWVEQFQNPRSIAVRHQCAMPEQRPLGRILRRADRRENDK